jgi:hypothetical protein
MNNDYNSITLFNTLNKPFKNFIKNIFIEKFNINISNKKLNSLKENIINNVFFIEDYEFNISRKGKNEYVISYYKINEDNETKFLFGCELETCILTQCSNNNLLIKLNEYKDIEDEKSTIEYWVMLVKTYIENIMFKYMNEDFISKFRYGCIIVHPKNNLIDYIVDFKKRTIYKNKDENITNKYKYLIFTRDSSLVCGDNLKIYSLSKDNITKEKLRKDSFHCEIVSPKLNNINDIIILYQNLFKNDCFKGNESAAFHVNVSMMNQNNEKIYFSRGFIDCFLNLYEKYENKNYDRFRPYGSWYAKRIREYSLIYTYKDIKPLLNFKDSKENNYFYENFIEGKKYYRSFIELQDNHNAKYNSIHTKERYIMEFRLFPTEDDRKILIEYIIDSIEILRKTNEIYSKNYSSVINKLQKLNEEIEISYEPLNYYEGYVYYYKEYDDKFYDLKDFGDVFAEFEKTLQVHNQIIKRYQKIADEENYDEYEGIVLNILNNESKNFNLKFFNKDGYIIFKSY